jgi:DNA-binding winged helix-turn-helix (wHTH) protein
MFSGRIWRFSNCEFDDLRMELHAGTAEVKLEPKPLEVLHVLLSRAGEVITKQELLDAVWPDESVVEGVLTTNINKLREAIGDHGKKTIVTIRGIGYKLTGSVQWENATSRVEPVPAITEDRLFPAADSGGFPGVSMPAIKWVESGSLRIPRLTSSACSSSPWMANACAV